MAGLDGANLTAVGWELLSNLVWINIVVAAADSRYSIGRVVRNVQIAQRSFDAIREADGEEINNAEKFAIALLARNMPPNSGFWHIHFNRSQWAPKILRPVSTIFSGGKGRGSI